MTENAPLSEVIDAVRRVVPCVRVSIVEPPHPQQTSYGVSDERVRGLGFQPKGSLEKGVREVVERFKAFLPRIRKRSRAEFRWMLNLITRNF